MKYEFLRVKWDDGGYRIHVVQIVNEAPEPYVNQLMIFSDHHFDYFFNIDNIELMHMTWLDYEKYMINKYI